MVRSFSEMQHLTHSGINQDLSYILGSSKSESDVAFEKMT